MGVIVEMPQRTLGRFNELMQTQCQAQGLAQSEASDVWVHLALTLGTRKEGLSASENSSHITLGEVLLLPGLHFPAEGTSKIPLGI